MTSTSGPAEAEAEAEAEAVAVAVGLSDVGRADENENENENGLDGGRCDYGRTPSWKERIDASIARSRKVRGSNYVQLSTVDVDAMEPRCRTVVFRGFLRGVPERAVAEATMMIAGGGDGGGGGGGDDDDDDADERRGACGHYGECVVRMITDSRSNKVREASSLGGGVGNDVAEMVWWFPKSSEQYRIRGRLRFVGRDDRPSEDVYETTTTTTTTTSAGMTAAAISEYFSTERRQVWGNLSDAAREQFYWVDPGSAFVSPSPPLATPPPRGGRDADTGRVLPPPDNFLLMLLYPSRIDYLRLTDNYRQVDEWNWDGRRGARRDGCDNDDDAAGAGGSSCRWASTRVHP